MLACDRAHKNATVGIHRKRTVSVLSLFAQESHLPALPEASSSISSVSSSLIFSSVTKGSKTKRLRCELVIEDKCFVLGIFSLCKSTKGRVYVS